MTEVATNKFGTLVKRSDEIAGTSVDVFCSSSGMFSVLRSNWHEQDASELDSLGSGREYDKAIASARSRLSKERVKLNIPFITKKGEKGIATGIHQRNRTVLCKIDGQAEALSYGTKVFKADIPDVEIKQVQDLQERIDKARRELKLLDDEYEFNLHETVTRAVEEAATETARATA